MIGQELQFIIAIGGVILFLLVLFSGILIIEFSSTIDQVIIHYLDKIWDEE